MDFSEKEKFFVEYRKVLLNELQKLYSYISLYRCIHEHRADRLDAINTAPAFFSVTLDALFTSIILWSEKLFYPRSERGLINFLAFIESNLDILSVDALKKRKEYPDGHWMLNREPLTLAGVLEDKKRLLEAPGLKSIVHRRDKFHAHFDKEYFFEREKIQAEAPIKWSDLTNLKTTSSEIINKYSAGYDGNLYEIEPINADDVEVVLNILNDHHRQLNG